MTRRLYPCSEMVTQVTSTCKTHVGAYVCYHHVSQTSVQQVILNYANTCSAIADILSTKRYASKPSSALWTSCYALDTLKMIKTTRNYVYTVCYARRFSISTLANGITICRRKCLIPWNTFGYIFQLHGNIKR